MFGGEGVSFEAGGELLLFRGIKHHFERSHVGLDENVGRDDLGRDVDTLAVLRLIGCERGRLRIGTRAVGAWVGKTRVMVTAHVVPRPAIEAACLD